MELAVLKAWNQKHDWIMAEEGELERRLARRQSASFRRPLRAFCVAIRASDHRVNDYHAEICPRHALTKHGPGHEGRYAEHVVVITDTLVEVACRPFQITAPGEPADHVAAKLGCSVQDVRTLRRIGLLRTDLKPGLMGRRGPPVPRVFTRQIMDPAARGKRGQDWAMGSEWLFAHIHMPTGFRQNVMRVPRYRRIGGRDNFQGWSWICPCCRRNAYTLYYPQSHPDLAVMQGFARLPAGWQQTHAPIFACSACHGVIWFFRTDLRTAWHQLVLHYSGGLLYGHEVEKPAWLKAEEPKQRRPRPESAKRELVKRLLATTQLTQKEIGQRAKMSRRSVGMMATAIYRREGVKARKALREKMAGEYAVEVEKVRAAG